MLLKMKIIMAFRNITLNVRLIFIIIIILSTSKFTKNDTKLNYNIPSDVHLTPLHYDVEIKFDVHKNVFFGKCNIIIQIYYPIQNTVIKSSGIFGITNIDLTDNDNKQTTPKKYPIKVNIKKFPFSNETNIYIDFIHNQLSYFLSPGTYILKMIYVRPILDNKNFFESYHKYIEMLDNERIRIIKAGELFPCWTEWIFKSTFNISIYHHKNYRLLSNMRIQKTIENINNMQWTFFDKSPLMSSQHLIIVIINNATSYINIKSTANFKFWCRKEIINHMQFAENISQIVVNYLKQRSTKIFPIIHYIAIKNFQHANIKILGLILLREEDIFYNEKLDHIARKMEIANLIAYHTISHWYDDVFFWSKEGFITFLAAYILDQSNAYYRMIDLFVVQTQQEVLRFNTLSNKNTFSLHTANVSTADLFKSSFHYIKSSVIWRTLYHLMSDDVFWTSINIYSDRQYHQSNTLQTDELWNIMQTISYSRGSTYNNIHLRIKDIINTWITEEQYSQLYVNRTNLNSSTVFWLRIRCRFYDEAKYSTLVTYMTKSKLHGHFWLDQHNSYRYSRKVFDEEDWIIINLQQGYYRVNYNTENWKQLADYLYYKNLSSIHVLNRAQFIDDAFYFFMQRQLNFTMFWNITKFLFRDTDYVAWYPMIKAVEYMTCILGVENSDIKDKIKEMFRELLQNIRYLEDERFIESDFTKYLREEAVKWACVLGEPKCRILATIGLIEDLENSTQDLPLRWKEWIYCKGLMEANDTIWVEVYEKWNKTKDDTLLEYLTCSTNPTINKNYLSLMEHEIIYAIKQKKGIFANIILLIIARHAKNDIVLKSILQKLKRFIKLSSKNVVDYIAIMIVIITHDTSTDHFKKISKFVKENESNLLISGKHLIDAVQQKIEKRKKEFERQVKNHKSLTS